MSAAGLRRVFHSVTIALVFGIPASSPRAAIAQPVARQPVVRAEVQLETPWLAILREANARQIVTRARQRLARRRELSAPTRHNPALCPVNGL